MRLKLCRDKNCLRRGIELPITDFPKNVKYLTQGERDGRHPYCRRCSVRRTAEYKENIRTLIARGAMITVPPSFRTDYHKKEQAA